MSWLAFLSRRPSKSPQAWIQSRVVFHNTLNAERLRADRGGPPFALVEVCLTGDEAFAVLRSRVRETDQVGFSSRGSVFVLLWNTDVVGACQFVQTLDPEHFDSPRVWIYPPAKLPPSNDQETAHSIDPTEQPELPTIEALFTRPTPLWKRTLDILGATLGLVVAAPILIVSAVAIRLTSQGPILFRQRRTGLGGRTFTIFKLRTMRIGAEAEQDGLRGQSEQDGPAFKMKDDPRVTRVGRYLRKTCIDELPQLWNVLKGDMTLVGPRPLPAAETDACEVWQRRRLDVTPGLTCIWQVDGKSRVPFVQWMRMDLRYINTRSLMNDLRLVFRTIVQVVLHRGSH